MRTFSWVQVVLRFIPMLALLVGIAPVSADPGTVEKITVGVSIPLTGDLAASGTDAKNALEYANKHFLGGKYHLIFEDDRCDPSTGMRVANKFIFVHRVKYLVGMFCNSVLLTTHAAYQKNRVLMITAGATSGDQLNIGPGVFRPYPADHFAAIVLAEYAAKRFKKIGVLTELDEYTSLMERHFLSRLNELNPKIEAAVEQVAPATRDYRSVVLRLKSRGIDAIFINSMGDPGFIEVVKTLKQLGMGIERLSNLFPSSPTVQSALGDLNNGNKFSNYPLIDTKFSSIGKETMKDFEAKYGPPQSVPLFVPLAMDMLRLLDAALASGRDPAEFISQTTFEGLLGPMTFDKNGAINSVQYEMQEIVRGTPVKMAFER